MRTYESVGPWGLQVAQARTLDAILTHGRNKAAARVLGVSLRTIEANVYQARERIRSRGGPAQLTRATLLRLWMEYRGL
jgi:hypothetical protein